MSNDVSLDYKAIKNNADIRVVLAELGVLDGFRQEVGVLWRLCPFCNSTKNGNESLLFYIEEKSFYCGPCGAKGCILDFVMRLHGVTLFEAGLIVENIMESSGAKYVFDAMGEVAQEKAKGDISSYVSRLAESRCRYSLNVLTFEEAFVEVSKKRIREETVRCVDISQLRRLQKINDAKERYA